MTFLRLQLRDCFCVVAVCYVLLLVTLLLVSVFEQLFSLNARCVAVQCSNFNVYSSYLCNL